MMSTLVSFYLSNFAKLLHLKSASKIYRLIGGHYIKITFDDQTHHAAKVVTLHC